MTNPHGNAGNTHALKDKTAASSIITIRCTPSAKAKFVKAANKRGQKLSEFALGAMHDRAER